MAIVRLLLTLLMMPCACDRAAVERREGAITVGAAALILKRDIDKPTIKEAVSLIASLLHLLQQTTIKQGL